MNRLKKELNVLKSWGIKEISIDKILYMINNIEDSSNEDSSNEDDSEDNCIRKIFNPPEIKEEGVDKYFRYIPMDVILDMPTHLYQDRYSTGGIIPKSYVWIH